MEFLKTSQSTHGVASILDALVRVFLKKHKPFLRRRFARGCENIPVDIVSYGDIAKGERRRKKQLVRGKTWVTEPFKGVCLREATGLGVAAEDPLTYDAERAAQLERWRRPASQCVVWSTGGLRNGALRGAGVRGTAWRRAERSPAVVRGAAARVRKE